MLKIILIIVAVIVFFALLFIVIHRKKTRSKDTCYADNKQLYIGNLSYQMNAHHLKQLFSPYGELQQIHLIKNPRTGRSKGFAFVTFLNSNDAKKALSENGKTIRGRTIVVRIAKPRES